ncbi:hypothetical protein [Blastococcus brunescens]|uniref:Ankyrin repeat domain-containing protein n=1 Tax=Blastococcus brunescens TaxID=1564165 RepID=A0ABZ1ATA3_9ACTN|nr:hypothetical protein [Blastococcus sp. BMG 8361]WRL61745.1 hypothetical protein U6N30_16575 [Blastococcus sp. BMG 8361]
MNLTNDKGDTLLILAAYHGHPGTVGALLDRGPTTRGPTTAGRPRSRRPSSGSRPRPSRDWSPPVPTPTPVGRAPGRRRRSSTCPR